MTPIHTRKVKDHVIVKVNNEPWSVFLGGSCIAVGFPNLNTARMWVLGR